MSLEFAILGFLNYLPLAGYDLKKRFDQSVRHFWPADQSQIYQSLARLTKRGLTEVELIPQSDRPSRKVYHITDLGRQALHDWLAGPLPLTEARHAELVQVFFGAQLTDAELVDRFTELARLTRERLEQIKQYNAVIERYAAELNLPRDAFCWTLALEYGERSAQAQAQWAEDALARIRRGRLPPRQAEGQEPSEKESHDQSVARRRRKRAAR